MKILKHKNYDTRKSKNSGLFQCHTTNTKKGGLIAKKRSLPGNLNYSVSFNKVFKKLRKKLDILTISSFVTLSTIQLKTN